MKKAWMIAKEVSPFLATLVAIFGWLGISPDEVGEKAYSVLRMAWPFVIGALGFASGWGARKLWANRTKPSAMTMWARAETERGLREQFDRLEPRAQAYLVGLVTEGVISVNDCLYWQVEEKICSLDLESFVDVAQRGSTVELRLTPAAKRLFDRNTSLLDGAREYLSSVGDAAGVA